MRLQGFFPAFIILENAWEARGWQVYLAFFGIDSAPTRLSSCAMGLPAATELCQRAVIDGLFQRGLNRRAAQARTCLKRVRLGEGPHLIHQRKGLYGVRFRLDLFFERLRLSPAPDPLFTMIRSTLFT